MQVLDAKKREKSLQEIQKERIWKEKIGDIRLSRGKVKLSLCLINYAQAMKTHGGVEA
jgi:hypothetical protein